ncbi:MAG TPA: TetR/AcrR family transcriptional regulator [Nocardioidaceae bacterium]|nr:TetR/AcrR family transcriptional regulator [Nocardioidaceae bacterium]
MPNVRQTSEDIDRAIIDIAAGLFARHGYAGTSLAHIASEVGYSKAGLIHRFGNKEGLYRAILDAATTTGDELIAYAERFPFGPERERAAAEQAVEHALDHVGVMLMIMNAFQPDSDLPNIEEMQVQCLRILATLDVALETPADAIRLVLSMQLLVNAITVQTLKAPFDLTMPREQFVPYVVDLALHTLHAPVAPPALS